MKLLIIEGADKLGKSTYIKSLLEESLEKYYLIKSPNRNYFSSELTDYYLKSGSSCKDFERQYYFTVNEQMEFLKLMTERPDFNGTVISDRLNIISSFIYRPPKKREDRNRYKLAVETFNQCLKIIKSKIEQVELIIFMGNKPFEKLDKKEAMEKNWKKKNESYGKYGRNIEETEFFKVCLNNNLPLKVFIKEVN